MIWVSNHGGRQLDHALRRHGRAARDRQRRRRARRRVIVDGGVQRGTDVLKAVALGAEAVAIGRLQAWGLAADGKDGLVRVLEILENEMISAMGLLGVTSVDQLTPKYVIAVRAGELSPRDEPVGQYA